MSRKSEKTRKRILQATWDLLETSKGQNVSMSDIAKASEISRQAVYLHFGSRAELLIATTRYVDEVKDIDARLVTSRTAPTGILRLEAYIEAWGNYIPEIYGVSRALMATLEWDDAAAEAWNDRMQAVRHGCAAAIHALSRDGDLIAGLSSDDATDMLWTLLSVRNWEQLCRTCEWAQEKYVQHMKLIARQTLVSGSTQ